MFGLSVDSLHRIRSVFSRFPKIQKVILYGSRAKGNYKKGSDIDITLVGKGLTLKNTVYPLMEGLYELYLPYKFDISIFNKLAEPDFISHILRVGKTFYQKENDVMKRWSTIPLTDACLVFTDGDWVEKKDQSPSGIRLIQTGNVGDGSFKNRLSKARYISTDTFDDLKCTEILAGDCLVSRLPYPVGRSCIIPDTGERMITAVDCSIIRFKRDTAFPEFFRYYSQSRSYLASVDEYCTGATRRRISRKNLGKVLIPLPPLPEQERIVAILGEAFAAIATATANTKKNLANAQEFFESELTRAFSQNRDRWAEKYLEELSLDFGRGKSKHRPRNASFLYGGDYPFVQTGDIRISEHIISNYTQSYSEAGLSQSKLWPVGTVCITIAANIAETGILGFDACFPDSVIGMVPDLEKTSGGYVEYMLQFFKKELQRQGKGSAQDNINLGTFKGQKFPFAPLPEQQAITAKLDALSEQTNTLKKVQQHKLTALNELKQSILHKAFTGELTADTKVADCTLSEASV